MKLCFKYKFHISHVATMTKSPIIINWSIHESYVKLSKVLKSVWNCFGPKYFSTIGAKDKKAKHNILIKKQGQIYTKDHLHPLYLFLTGISDNLSSFALSTPMKYGSSAYSFWPQINFY